jgi:hypothetical protein
MEWILIIAICGGAAFLTWYLHNRKKTELISKGLMIERGSKFYKQAHVFSTAVSDFAAIAGAIDQHALSDQKITFEPYVEQGQIVFHNRISFGSFRARLKTLGFQDGLYHYQFQVEAWRDGQHGTTRQDLFGANVLLTAIERAFLRLDPETGADRAHAAYSTNPSLI